MPSLRGRADRARGSLALRRRFVLIGAAAILAAPRVMGAPPAGRTVRVGRLSPLSAEVDTPFMNAFRQEFQELGWVEGRSFTLVTRFAEGRADRLPRLAASLVQDGVDVIVVGSNPGALAARKATSSIPIVMVTTGDPICGGIVTSLARPRRQPDRRDRPGRSAQRETTGGAQGSHSGDPAGQRPRESDRRRTSGRSWRSERRSLATSD